MKDTVMMAAKIVSGVAIVVIATVKIVKNRKEKAEESTNEETTE